VNATPRLELRRPDVHRFAEESDAIAALFTAARRDAMPWLRVVHDDAETRAWMRGEVLPKQSVWLAALRGEIVGFAARDGAWLMHLYVKSGWSRHGSGQRLLDAVIAEAATKTAVLRVATFQRNAGARRFYERNGFVAARLGDGRGNEEGEPDVVYELALAR
jgi:GNAT superfamily N-acetyltransferase